MAGIANFRRILQKTTKTAKYAMAVTRMKTKSIVRAVAGSAIAKVFKGKQAPDINKMSGSELGLRLKMMRGKKFIDALSNLRIRNGGRKSIGAILARRGVSEHDAEALLRKQSFIREIVGLPMYGRLDPFTRAQKEGYARAVAQMRLRTEYLPEIRKMKREEEAAKKK